MGVNDAWLGQVAEEPLEPDLPILDAHHHMWGKRDHRAAVRYLLDDYLADTKSGHTIVSTVHVDSHAIYRAAGPEAMKPVGEVEFANGMAAMAASADYGGTRVASAIVGHADMRLGRKVGRVLDAMMRAAPRRFRGIRHCVCFDEDASLPRHPQAPRAGLLAEPDFRAGVAELGKRGLVFETYVWHPQIDELTALARALPKVSIVVDHCGTPVGQGRYAGKRGEVMAAWRKSMAELAKCDNVTVKLGGVNMLICGHGWNERAKPPTSDEMLAAAGPVVEETIALFGTDRGMMESNYPAERICCGFGPLWNFLKKVTKGYSADEKRALYHDNAARVFGLRG